MAKTYRILGQVNPSTAGKNILLYTVPSDPRSKQATVESINVADRTSPSTTFRIFVVPRGSSPSENNALYYDIETTEGEPDTFNASIHVTLAAGDSIYVSAGATTLTFHAFGFEENV